MVLRRLDDAEGIENHHLTPERLPISARHGEILALDIENGDRTLWSMMAGMTTDTPFPARVPAMATWWPARHPVWDFGDKRSIAPPERPSGKPRCRCAEAGATRSGSSTGRVHGPSLEILLDDAGAATVIARKMKNSGTGRPMRGWFARQAFALPVNGPMSQPFPGRFRFPDRASIAPSLEAVEQDAGRNGGVGKGESRRGKEGSPHS